jgi:two-component system, cell cycle sensor histidine kinase and response regulator CckA
VTATLPRRAETILVVEDEEELRQLIGRLLERLGYTVLVAADGASALELCGRQPSIDLLLTDVMMPGIGGLELTRLLLEQRPTLKAIYMSGFGPEVIAQQGAINPTVPFLAKPFTVAALGSKIRGVLGTSRVQ